MKKLLLVFLVAASVLAAAFVGFSYWVGIQSEKQYHLLLEQASRRGQLELSNRSYERGLFHSEAVTTVALSIPERADRLEFALRNSISHGPITFVSSPRIEGTIRPALAVIRTRPAPGGEMDDALRKLLETVPELANSEFLTILSLDGAGESFIDVPAFKKQLDSEEGGKVEVECGGFISRAHFDILHNSVKGSFSAPFFSIGEGDGRFRLRELKGEYSSQPGIKDINVGWASFSVARVELTDKEAGNTPFLLQSSAIRAEAAVSGETITASLQVHFDRLNVAEETCGPFSMELDLRKLDPSALSRLLQMTADLQGKMPEPGEGGKSALSLPYAGLLMDLLAKSPELELKELKVRTPRGDLSGKARLGMEGSDPKTADNPFALLNNISASADLSVSEALFFALAENILRGQAAAEESGPANGDRLDALARQKARSLSDSLLSQKIMVRKDGAFLSNAAYKHGRLTVNGRKMQVWDLLKIQLGD